MAIDRLSLYNDALRILGERKLASLSENREPRHRLDDVYDFGAIDLCAEMAKPRFASKVKKLDTFSTSTEHAFPNVFDLPNDYLVLVQVFSNDTLDEPVTRFFQEGRTIATDHDVVYVRYISSTSAADLTLWLQSFARVVSSYLAREVAPRLNPDLIEVTSEKFNEYLQAFLQSDASEETRPRSRPPTTTLSTDWLNIYNDALFLLGLDQLITPNDDSERRVKLDKALDQALVEYHLENTAWQWAVTSTKIDYNPSLEPEWGYQRAFDKPDDLLRIDGVFVDEYFVEPLKNYADEGDTIFAEQDELYLHYVPNTALSQPSSWPAFFKKLIAADLARHAALSLGADPTRALEAYEERERSAFSNDAMASPPQRIASGNWVEARWNWARGRRRRP